MTQVEKRGIAGAYKKGCGCDVSKIIFLYTNQNGFAGECDTLYDTRGGD